jgi:hypothetical protein
MVSLERPKIYDIRLEYNHKMLYFKRSNVGNRSSDFFQQENRWSVDGSQGPGPITTWNNPKFMKTLMGPYFTLGLDEVNRTNTPNLSIT